MKTLMIAILLLVLQSGKLNFHQLHILEGTWRMETKKGFLYESWVKVNDFELRSKSYRLHGQDTVLLERVSLLREGADAFYIPAVVDQHSGQPVRFKLTSSEGGKFVFENSKHDYPQRIIYKLVGRDSVIARIEGTTSSGQSGGSNFHFVRIK